MRKWMTAASSICFAPDIVIGDGGGSDTSAIADVAATAAVAEHVAEQAAEDIEELAAEVEGQQERLQWQSTDLDRLATELSELRQKVERLEAGQMVTLEASVEALATAETALEVATEENNSSEVPLPEAENPEMNTSITQTEASSETGTEVPGESAVESLPEEAQAVSGKKSLLRML